MADVTRRVRMSLRAASGVRWHLLFLWIRYVGLVILLFWLWVAVMPPTFPIGLWHHRSWLISLLISLIGVLWWWSRGHWWRLPPIQKADKKPYGHRQHGNEEQCAYDHKPHHCAHHAHHIYSPSRRCPSTRQAASRGSNSASFRWVPGSLLDLLCTIVPLTIVPQYSILESTVNAYLAIRWGHALANYICAGFSLCASPLLERRSRAMTSEPDISVFRPDRPGIRKVLGDLEAEIMELVWSRPADQGTTVRDVFEILYERRLSADRRRIAYTTVMNTMARLAKKNLLRVEKQDQAYIYFPNLTQQEFVSRFVGRILENLYVNFSGATLEGLEALPDQETATRVRQQLDEIARRRALEEGE